MDSRKTHKTSYVLFNVKRKDRLMLKKNKARLKAMADPGFQKKGASIHWISWVSNMQKHAKNPTGHAHEVFVVKRSGVGSWVELRIPCATTGIAYYVKYYYEAVSNDRMTLETREKVSVDIYHKLKFWKHVGLQHNRANNFYEYLDCEYLNWLFIVLVTHIWSLGISYVA